MKKSTMQFLELSQVSLQHRVTVTVEGERTLLSEADVDGEELECPSCGNTFSIVSGDSISDLDQAPLKIFDVTEDDNQIFLNI